MTAFKEFALEKFDFLGATGIAYEFRDKR